MSKPLTTPASAAEIAAEAYYQQALLAHIFQSHADAPDAYQRNAAANAVRALAVIHPAVHAFLGERDFAALARRYWQDCPPTRGDWSQYRAAQGYSLGDWLAQRDYGGVVSAVPWLPAMAQLDDALSTAQDAPNAVLDTASLSLLMHPADTVRVHLHPSVQLLSVLWDAAALLSLRETLLVNSISIEVTHSYEYPCPEAAQYVLINRPHWRSQAQILDTASTEWVRQCLQGSTLEQAHEAAITQDASFEFASCLSWLLQHQVLHHVSMYNTGAL
jgi:Putative DNA-binding domain